MSGGIVEVWGGGVSADLSHSGPIHDAEGPEERRCLSPWTTSRSVELQARERPGWDST